MSCIDYLILQRICRWMVVHGDAAMAHSDTVCHELWLSPCPQFLQVLYTFDGSPFIRPWMGEKGCSKPSIAYRSTAALQVYIL